MSLLLAHLWSEEQGQDIAEYAVMLAVILVVVIGTIRLIGSNATMCSRRQPVRSSRQPPRSISYLGGGAALRVSQWGVRQDHHAKISLTFSRTC